MVRHPCVMVVLLSVFVVHPVSAGGLRPLDEHGENTLKAPAAKLNPIFPVA